MGRPQGSPLQRSCPKKKPRMSIRGFRVSGSLQSRSQSLLEGELVGEARGRDLRCHFDIGKDLKVVASAEEVWLPGAEVGITVFAAKQPVLSELPFHAGADRPSRQPSTVSLHVAREAARARGSVAAHSRLDPLKRDAARAINHDIGSHQEAQTRPKAEVVLVFDTGRVKGRSAWQKGASEGAAAKEAGDAAGLIIKRVVAFDAQHPGGAYL